METAVQIDGEPVVEELRASFLKVGDRFFETVGIPMVRGRDISEEDLVSRRKVAVVNEAFARRYFGTRNPLRTPGQGRGFGNQGMGRERSAERPVV